MPPGKTASTITAVTGWSRELISIGDEIRFGGLHLDPNGDLSPLRSLLDRMHDRSPHMTDPLSGLHVPRVTVEIRAGVDVPHGVVQTVEQILTDSIDPVTRRSHVPHKPFIHVEFTARDAG